MFGLLRGIGSGGDRRIAVFESRALFYVLVIYVLVTNVFTTRRQYERVLMVAMVAIGVQSVFALQYYLDLPADEQAVLERLGEHASAVHMAAVVVLLLATFLLNGTRATRWLLLAMMPAIVTAFMLSQRRAAMVALMFGAAVICFFAFHRRRRAFWVFVPAVAILGAGFVAATWGAVGAIGLPAQAVKSVIAPGTLDAADQSSNFYREIEATNVWFTIRNSPLLGVGFGQPFSILYRMPDISFYEFWAYKPHHSVLWIWLKMGFLGFVATLFMIGRTIQAGARSALDVETRREVAYVATAVAIIFMLVIYSYVDIGWDSRSMVLLGLCIAICTDYVNASRPAAARTPSDEARLRPELVR
ncbi:MAG: O-antigen ligase family protein [Ilumatobacteraceae bacterium]